MSDYYRLGGNDHLNLPKAALDARRHHVESVNEIDKAYGVSRYHSARGNVSNWTAILACLPPNDENDGLTIHEIHDILCDLEYNIKIESVRNALFPMLSRNPRTIAQMSNINRLILSRINGIQSTRINEGGASLGCYTLGIGIRKLEELVAKKEFLTYSFNLNDNNGVRLVGI